MKLTKGKYLNILHQTVNVVAHDRWLGTTSVLLKLCVTAVIRWQRNQYIWEIHTGYLSCSSTFTRCLVLSTYIENIKKQWHSLIYLSTAIVGTNCFSQILAHSVSAWVHASAFTRKYTKQTEWLLFSGLVLPVHWLQGNVKAVWQLTCPLDSKQGHCWQGGDTYCYLGHLVSWASSWQALLGRCTWPDPPGPTWKNMAAAFRIFALLQSCATPFSSFQAWISLFSYNFSGLSFGLLCRTTLTTRQLSWSVHKIWPVCTHLCCIIPCGNKRNKAVCQKFMWLQMCHSHIRYPAQHWLSSRHGHCQVLAEGQLECKTRKKISRV